MEDAARHARYEAFLAVARERGASGIALAHTADDQAETVCMRLLRGSGLMGLSGMANRRTLGELTVIRPMLGLWRADIEAYLTAHRLTARHDPTNADRRILRNRIRHELLPLLERRYNPNIKSALAQLADLSHWDAAFLRQAAERNPGYITRIEVGRQQHLALARKVLTGSPQTNLDSTFEGATYGLAPTR
jgi:tRNA(Ile)-lysidine synthase